MVRSLVAAFACMACSGADPLTRIAGELLAPTRRVGGSVECGGRGRSWKLESIETTSGWLWAREKSLTASISYEPVGILDALEVYVAFDRDGNGRIEKSEWLRGGADAARDGGGGATARVRDVPLVSGNAGWRIVQRYRDGTSMFDQCIDDGLIIEDP